MQAFLVAVGLLAIALLLLGLKIFFVKDGKFPNSHIGGNKHMSDRGIYCVNTTDKLERKEHSKGRLDIKQFDGDLNKNQPTC